MYEKKSQKPKNYDAIMYYALGLIARKRYTQKELENKFRDKKMGLKRDQKKVIARLKQLKYIDDKEFAKDYIQTRLLINPKGPNLLKLELKLKGVDRQTVDKVIELADIDEMKVALDVMERKKKAINRAEGQKRKEKIMRTLSSRGFKLDTIYKILEKW
ncbi:regulatory protein RecX [Patescibacteria group bacterium]